MLDPADAGLGAVLPELRFDDVVGALGLGSRPCVDEQRLAVTGNDESPALEFVGEAARLRPEIEPESVEQAFGVLFLELDSDPPVVVHETILAEKPACSRCLVIPPSQNGKPAPRISAVSTSSAVGTTPSSSRWRISSAIASSAVSRISSSVSGFRSVTEISARSSA